MSAVPTRDIVRRILTQHTSLIDSEELSYHAVAAMTEAERTEALLYLMPKLVRELQRRATPATTWAEATTEIVRVHGEDKHLADCTQPEVQNLADTRDRAATSFAKKAHHFRRISTTMREGNYAVVRDIPENIGSTLVLTAAEVVAVERDAGRTAETARKLASILADLEAQGSSPNLLAAQNQLARQEQRRDRTKERLTTLTSHVRDLLTGISPNWQATGAWARLRKEFRHEGQTLSSVRASEDSDRGAA